MAPPVRITSNLRTVPTPHVALELVDRRRFGSADDIERYGLAGIAAKAADFKVAVASIQRVA
jgi:hypothetical protein